MSTGGRDLAIVLGAAILTVVGMDLLLQRVAPLLPHRMEAEDGIRSLERGNPETLLIGSSHGRSFVGIAAEVDRASGGRRQMVVVPVEYGKLSSYEWILEHRLRPLLEERDDQGALRRPALRRFVVVTEWWDACSLEEGLAFNVPARGFTFGDFVSDVLRRGLNAWNQNYLDERWAVLFSGSILFQDRGIGRIREGLRKGIGSASRNTASVDEAEQRRLQMWRSTVESGASDPRCHDGAERAALERMLDWARSRSLDTTLVLFPRKPATLTDKARATTLARFSEEMAALARQRGIRFVDYTYLPVIDDGDFMADFDHVTTAGNRKLADWALGRDLSFLLEPAAVPRAAGPVPTGP
jgi:hypothetical protein